VLPLRSAEFGFGNAYSVASEFGVAVGVVESESSSSESSDSLACSSSIASCCGCGWGVEGGAVAVEFERGRLSKSFSGIGNLEMYASKVDTAAKKKTPLKLVAYESRAIRWSLGGSVEIDRAF